LPESSISGANVTALGLKPRRIGAAGYSGMKILCRINSRARNHVIQVVHHDDTLVKIAVIAGNRYIQHTLKVAQALIHIGGQIQILALDIDLFLADGAER
jgi:hypothetical protein